MAAFLAALAPALADAAGGVLSSIFGRRKEKKARKQALADWQMQRDAAKEDYIWQTGEGLKHLVKGAEAAGFNPLTVLRGGGGPGYMQTHTPVLSMQAYEGANMGDALAAGLRTGVQAAYDYDPIQEERAKIELDIAKAQLKRINEGNLSQYTRLGGAPSATGSRYRETLSLQPVPTQGAVEVTNPLPLGGVNPYTVDSEFWEKRYGDIAQEVGGLFINLPADTYWNLRPYLHRGYDYLTTHGRRFKQRVEQQRNKAEALKPRVVKTTPIDLDTAYP